MKFGFPAKRSIEWISLFVGSNLFMQDQTKAFLRFTFAFATFGPGNAAVKRSTWNALTAIIMILILQHDDPFQWK